jgi:hypothetical protein
MIKWVATLSNGEIATEGEEPWSVIPEERLPWPRLCKYLQENNLHIDDVKILDEDNNVILTQVEDEWNSKGEQPLYYSIQYDVELDNILGGGVSKTFLHLASHYDDHIEHFYIDFGTKEVRSEITKEYSPIVPSPSRKE